MNSESNSDTQTTSRDCSKTKNKKSKSQSASTKKLATIKSADNDFENVLDNKEVFSILECKKCGKEITNIKFILDMVHTMNCLKTRRKYLEVKEKQDGDSPLKKTKKNL
jgi:hypothetical protein